MRKVGIKTIERNGKRIVKIFRQSGFEAYFAGGYVRDRLLEREINDIDIATSADLETIEKLLIKNKIKVVYLGEKFGVLGALIGKTVYEVATFRTEFGTLDFRHPQKVKFGVTAKEDALRRDFTINGMFADKSQTPKTKFQNFEIQGARIKRFKWGTVIDFVGGLEDLDQKLIRFIGDPEERIKEDALRMLRAVRFASQLNFKIESKSFKAIKKNVRLIIKISAERIRDEIEKMLLSPKPQKAFLTLDRLGMLKIIFPEIADLKKIPQPKIYHAEGNAFQHIMEILKDLPKDALADFRWAALLHDIGKTPTMQTPEEHGTDRIRFSNHDVVGAKMAEEILKRMKFSNARIEKITWLIRNHMIFHNFLKMRIARQRRLMQNPNFSELLLLYKTDAIASIPSTPEGKILKPNLRLYYIIEDIYKKELARPPEPKKLISGHEVMRVLKIDPGPRVGSILEQIRDLQLEGKLKNKKQAINFIKKIKK